MNKDDRMVVVCLTRRKDTQKVSMMFMTWSGREVKVKIIG